MVKHSVNEIRWGKSRPTRLLLLAGLNLVLLPGFFLTIRVGRKQTGTISGIVKDDRGPVALATVRIQATSKAVFTNADGSFRLTELEENLPVTVSAWKASYYCAKIENVVPPAEDVEIVLHEYQTNDNPDYRWMPPVGKTSCASCKPALTEIWKKNAHAGSARNPRFLSMYNGSDIHGNRSPLTRFSMSRDYGNFPLPPDPTVPYYGPGYKLDFPTTPGNCATCHVPGAAVNAPYGTDPNRVTDADTFGVHCDFCHKIADVFIDDETGLPFSNMPGVLSTDVRRPFPDDPDRHQLFFGTFDDDNAPEEDTYLPLIEESQFCAPCHFGTFWGTFVYNSFGEWLESPYSEPSEGMTCQECHMPAPTMSDGKPLTNVALNSGGVERDPMRIHAHSQRGPSDRAFMESALEMIVDTFLKDSVITVRVELVNDSTGHHIPTDSPLRHLILLVRAEDSNGQHLRRISGPIIPEWGGIGDPDSGYYGGLPGKIYAKILQENWTGTTPTGSYWNPTHVISDNRLPAYGSDVIHHRFTAPVSGEAKIEVTLFFRRAFIDLMDQKGWNVPDVIMAHESIVLK